jgi:hypothetical protein
MKRIFTLLKDKPMVSRIEKERVINVSALQTVEDAIKREFTVACARYELRPEFIEQDTKQLLHPNVAKVFDVRVDLGLPDGPAVFTATAMSYTSRTKNNNTEAMIQLPFEMDGSLLGIPPELANRPTLKLRSFAKGDLPAFIRDLNFAIDEMMKDGTARIKNHRAAMHRFSARQALAMAAKARS